MVKVTDDQIRALRASLLREHRGRGGRARIKEVLSVIIDALAPEGGHEAAVSLRERSRRFCLGMIESRARIAEVINQRKGGV